MDIGHFGLYEPYHSSFYNICNCGAMGIRFNYSLFGDLEKQTAVFDDA